MTHTKGESTSDLEWNRANRAMHAACTIFNQGHRGSRYEVGHSFFGPDTGSMRPMLHNRCIWIWDRGAEFDSLKIGDIVQVKSGEKRAVIHVIVKKTRKGYFRTQGINNRAMDKLRLRPDNYLGRIVSIAYTDKQ